MYNSGLTPLANYERDMGRFDEIYADSLRLDLGIGARRFFLEDTVQGTPTDLKFDFTSLDKWVDLLTQRNVLPYPSWCYVPKPLQKDGSWKTLNTDLPDWQAAWKKVYSEYARHFQERGVKIGYNEVYNEPDLRGVFLDDIEFKSGVYLQMYKYGSIGLKEGNPDAVVGGPAYANGNLTASFVDFVTRENLPLDFLSFHTYLSGGWPQSYQTARHALASSPRYNTTEIHVNEINWLNGSYPDRGKPTSPNNKYAAAARNLDVIYDLIGKTDVTMSNWAQLLESTAGDDSYGLIRKDGHRKAAFNAFKIYSDMPEERVMSSSGDPTVKVMASSNEGHAAVAIWSTDATEHSIHLNLHRLPFESRELRLYRIDEKHASYFDNAPEDLEPEAVTTGEHSKHFQWTGVLPGRGVLYFAIDRGPGSNDFHPAGRDVKLGSIIRTHHYFEYGSEQPKTSYRFFDRRSWRAFLGMGNEKAANSLCGVSAEHLPAILEIGFRVSGKIRKMDDNSLLGIRVDYAAGSKFVKSVLLHGGIYSPHRHSAYPFSTIQAPDRVVKVDISDFRLRLADYAPSGWNEGGRVLISFQMQDTGPGTRSEVRVRAAQPVDR